MYNNDVTIRKSSYSAPREIKASANFDVVPVGITLDGTKFSVGELLLEGQCLVKDNVTGKYEKYTETTPGTFQPGKSDPVILDESIKIPVDDAGANVDVTAGQVLIKATVWKGMCIGLTDAFKAKNPLIMYR
jgi:hypothetical protein